MSPCATGSRQGSSAPTGCTGPTQGAASPPSNNPAQGAKGGAPGSANTGKDGLQRQGRGQGPASLSAVRSLWCTSLARSGTRGGRSASPATACAASCPAVSGRGGKGATGTAQGGSAAKAAAVGAATKASWQGPHLPRSSTIQGWRCARASRGSSPIGARVHARHGVVLLGKHHGGSLFTPQEAQHTSETLTLLLAVEAARFALMESGVTLEDSEDSTLASAPPRGRHCQDLRTGGGKKERCRSSLDSLAPCTLASFFVLEWMEWREKTGIFPSLCCSFSTACTN